MTRQELAKFEKYGDETTEQRELRHFEKWVQEVKLYQYILLIVLWIYIAKILALEDTLYPSRQNIKDAPVKNAPAKQKQEDTK